MEYKKNESGEHIRGKSFLKDLILKDNNNIREIGLEKKKGNRTPDIYVIPRTGYKIAVEYQNSRFSSKEVFPRTKDHIKNGFYVLWVLNGITYNKLPENSEDIMVYSEERELHKLCGGRVYYLNIKGMELKSLLYELHFERNYGRKNSFDARFRDIPLVKLELMSWNGLKLAKFPGKSIRTECIEDIRQHLVKYCWDYYWERKKRREKINTIIEIKVNKIVFDLIDKYGARLPYNILRFEKRWLKNIQFLDHWYESLIRININDWLKKLDPKFQYHY